jgi:hypothetical protein
MDDHWALYNRTTQWKLVFSFLLRRCELTHRRIWWEWCYRGNIIITGPGEPVAEYVYLSKETFIVERLAGRIK